MKYMLIFNFPHNFIPFNSTKPHIYNDLSISYQLWSFLLTNDYLTIKIRF